MTFTGAMNSCGSKRPKIGIFVVAYNAAKTIQAALSRVQPGTWDRIDQVFIIDDPGLDEASKVAGKFSGSQSTKIKVLKYQIDLGYEGNQKRGYRYAIDNNFDVVVLRHGDGQYAPEALNLLIDPIVNDGAGAVFGSRMLERDSALKEK